MTVISQILMSGKKFSLVDSPFLMNIPQALSMHLKIPPLKSNNIISQNHCNGISFSLSLFLTSLSPLLSDRPIYRSADVAPQPWHPARAYSTSRRRRSIARPTV
jgi:hypothetical protein